MSTSANTSNQVAALKELYDDPSDYLQNLVYKMNPLFAMLPKNESPDGFAGKYIPVPLVYANAGGRSANFATAIANQIATSVVSFFVYRVPNYSVVSIENELMEATTTNRGGFIEQSKLQIDTSIEQLANDLASDLFGSGTGTRGAIGTITLSGANTSVSITLSDANDVTKFEDGMVLVASATDGGTASTDTVTLTTINRITGVLGGTSSVSPSNTLSGNWAAAGFLAVQGDTPGSNPLLPQGSTAYTKMTGLRGWLPATDPASNDNFWGVNRSADRTRLAGIFYDGGKMTIEQGLTKGISLLSREGGRPDYIFVNPDSYSNLVLELGAKVQYVEVKHDEVEVSFTGIKFMCPYGVATVVSDRSCPSKTAFVLQMNTWKLRTLGKAPHILTYGDRYGLEGIPNAADDSLQIRVGNYGNLICNAPGRNAQIALSA